MFNQYLSPNGLRSFGSSWRFRFKLSGMAVAALERSCDDDPWKVSAFISAFLELLLSILLLLGAAIAFITSQFVKYFGLEPPCSYIGCSHPDHAEFSRHKKSPVYDPHVNGFSMDGLCHNCHLSQSYSKFQAEDFGFTDDCTDGSAFAWNHANEATSQFRRKEDSGLREHNAAGSDTDFGSGFNELGRRDHGSRDQAWFDLADTYLLCSNCNTSLNEKFNRRRTVKRKVTTVRDVSYRPCWEVADGTGVNGLGKSCEPHDEDSFPVYPEKSVMVDGSNSDSEGHAETSSMSSDSLKVFSLESPVCLQTGVTGIVEDTWQNADTEDNLCIGLASEKPEDAAEKIAEAQSLPLFGVERCTLPLDSSQENCQTSHGDGLARAEVPEDKAQQLTNTGSELALLEDSVESSHLEENSVEVSEKIALEFLQEWLDQGEGIEENGKLVLEDPRDGSQPEERVGKVERLVFVDACEASPLEEGIFEGQGLEEVAMEDPVEAFQLVDCIENRQESCKQEEITEGRTKGDLSDQGEDIGKNGELALEDSRDASESEETMEEVERKVVCQDAWKTSRLGEGSEGVAMEGPVDACQLEEGMTIGDLSESFQEESSKESGRGVAILDHPESLQHEENIGVALEDLPREAAEEGARGVPVQDICQEEQVFKGLGGGFSGADILEESQLKGNPRQEKGLTESVRGAIIVDHPELLQVEEKGGVVVREVVREHFVEETQQQEEGKLSVQDVSQEAHLDKVDKVVECQQEKSGPEDSLGGSQPDSTIGKDGRESAIDDILGVTELKENSEEAGKQLSSVVLSGTSEQQEISEEHGRKVGIDFLMEEAPQHEGREVLFEDFLEGHPEQGVEQEGKEFYVGDFLPETGITIQSFGLWPCQDAQGLVKNMEAVVAASQEAAESQEESIEAAGAVSLEGVHAASQKHGKRFEPGQREVAAEDFLVEVEHDNEMIAMGTDVSDIDNWEQTQRGGERMEVRKEALVSDPSETTSETIQEETIQHFATGTSVEDTGSEVQNQEEMEELGEVASFQDHPHTTQEEEEDTFSNEVESEEGVDGLKEALLAERHALAALEAELEQERNFSAIAASEAMAMISRLQEEKSAMQMEVAQFQRMSEEKAEYDQQAMSLLKEILFKREKEKFALEKEVELYRERLFRQKVEETKRTRLVKQKDSLSMETREPVLLLKGIEEEVGSLSEEEQTQEGIETDFLGLDQERKFTSGGSSAERFGLGPLQNLESADHKPIKRLRGLPLEGQEEWFERTSGVQKSFLEGTSSESNRNNHCKAGEARQMVGGHQDHMENLGRSVFATDDEETQFILERLWVLEEELQELRGREESGSLKNGSKLQELQSQDHSPGNVRSSMRNEEISGFSGDSDGVVFNTFPKTPGTSGTGGDKDSIGFRIQRGAACRSPSMVECYGDGNGNHVDPWNLQFMDGSFSLGQGEETQMHGDGLAVGGFLPVHDIYEVHHASKQSRCYPSDWEGSENIEDTGDRLGKPDLSPGNISQECLLSTGKGMTPGPRRSARARRLFSPHDITSHGPNDRVDSNGWVGENSPYPNDDWALDVPQHDFRSQSMVLRDHRRLATEEEVQQLTMRLQVLEADRELLRQTLESLKHKDTGIDLLQEIVQHLRELRMVDTRGLVTSETLRGVEPTLMSSVQTCTPVIKKRRYWSGPGQTQQLTPHSGESV